LSSLPCWVQQANILIATTCLVLVLVAIGDESWPLGRSSYWRVAALATLAGIAYTPYSEWRHAVVLHHWTYSAVMPVVLGLGVGLLPLLQWMLIPPVAFFLRYPHGAAQRMRGLVSSHTLTTKLVGI
jgi:hypothetical protein